MKALCLLLTLTLLTPTVTAQTNRANKRPRSRYTLQMPPPQLDKHFMGYNDHPAPLSISPPTIFICGEGVAHFPGNLPAFIATEMHYPLYALNNEIEGRVLVTFKVLKDGCISDPKVLRSPDTSLATEALRIIHLMPAWQPATKNGQPTESWFTIPFTFRLD
jgi:TonB family protein